MRLLVQAEKMKLCLSSIETKFGVLPDSVLDKANYILESFFYIQPEMMDYCLSRPFFIMDSGAFTFRENAKRQVSYKDFVEGGRATLSSGTPGWTSVHPRLAYRAG